MASNLEFRQGENERVWFLFEGEKKRGCAWQPGWSRTWCWALHGPDGPIAEGDGEHKNDATTDLVAAYWKHIDPNKAFPA